MLSAGVATPQSAAAAAEIQRQRTVLLNKSIESRRQLMVYEMMDRQRSCSPDAKSSFQSFDDAFERLSVYHTFETQLPSAESRKKFDQYADNIAIDVIKKMGKMETDLGECENRDRTGSATDEVLTLEKMVCGQLQVKLKGLREARAKAFEPEKLLCLVHGIPIKEIRAAQPMQTESGDAS